MSLNVTLTAPRVVSVYDSNITHNLASMATAAGIYHVLWRPEDVGTTKAKDLIAPLTEGLAVLRANPAKFKCFYAPNGWGPYLHFIAFLEAYLQACIDNPDADVSVSR